MWTSIHSKFGPISFPIPDYGIAWKAEQTWQEHLIVVRVKRKVAGETMYDALERIKDLDETWEQAIPSDLWAWGLAGFQVDESLALEKIIVDPIALASFITANLKQCNLQYLLEMKEGQLEVISETTEAAECAPSKK